MTDRTLEILRKVAEELRKPEYLGGLADYAVPRAIESVIIGEEAKGGSWKSELAGLLDGLGTIRRDKAVTFQNIDELVFQLRKDGEANPERRSSDPHNAQPPSEPEHSGAGWEPSDNDAERALCAFMGCIGLPARQAMKLALKAILPSAIAQARKAALEEAGEIADDESSTIKSGRSVTGREACTMVSRRITALIEQANG